MEQGTQGYTIRESAAQIGASIPWIRKQIRQGTIQPPQVIGRHGNEYRLSDTDLGVLRGSYKRGTSRQGTALNRYAEIEANLMHALAEVAAAQARADERQTALDHERQRVEHLEAQLLVERERRERMQSLGFWDYLRGRQHTV